MVTGNRTSECSYCNKKIELKSYQIRRNHRSVFCGKICYGKFQRNQVSRTCVICSISFNVPPSGTKNGNARTCSRACHYKWQEIRPQKTGVNHHCWKGGKSIINGYWFIKGIGYEHRIILEKSLGRKLDFKELVHHKDGNRLNNEISNLEIMTRSAHTALHHKNRRSKETLLER